MKNIAIILLSTLALMLGGKELRVLVLTPNPKMHCESCEKKIKGNMRFEKGITSIETSIPDQTVTITYQPDKTDVKTLQAAMKKIGYTTEVKSDTPAPKAKSKKDKTAKSETAKGK